MFDKKDKYIEERYCLKCMVYTPMVVFRHRALSANEAYTYHYSTRYRCMGCLSLFDNDLRELSKQ